MDPMYTEDGPQALQDDFDLYESKLASGSLPTADKPSLESITSETLCYHAKLCVVAQRYLIEPLKDLCLRNLYITLQGFKSPRTQDTIDLLQYLYPAGGVEGLPELRELVLLYVVTRKAISSRDDRLKQLMIENGHLGYDFFEKFSRISGD